MKNILLYLASNSNFYHNLFFQIKRGFEELGFNVIGGSNLLDSNTLLREINKYNPCFVLEMNRTKNEIDSFPKGLIHICWLFDFWGRLHHEIEGSDILYCFAEDWIENFKNKSKNKNVLYLPPGTDNKIYKPLNLNKSCDFLFLGHIPNNWSEAELNRKIGFIGQIDIKYKDILEIIKYHTLHRKDFDYSLNEFIEKNKIRFKQPFEKVLEYDINSRAVRQIRRKRFLELFVKNKEFKTRIFGSENWKNYKYFSELYVGYLENPKEINKELSKSKILLHDGDCPHFRTFDAMASKCCVAASETHSNNIDSWLTLGFKENEDFIKINFFSGEIDFNMLKNQNLLKDIRENAYKKIINSHLWLHRAEKIINDLKILQLL